MPFLELSWDEQKKQYKEIDNDGHFFDGALFNNEKKHFFLHNWVEFCLLYVPKPEMENLHYNDSLPIGPIGHTVTELSRFCANNELNYSFLSEDAWKPGYTDYSAQTDIVSLLNLIVTKCVAHPIALTRPWELTQVLSIHSLTEASKTINSKFYDKPQDSPCYMHLFIISEDSYNIIKKSSVKLPNIIAGIFKFECDNQPREHIWYHYKVSDEK